MIVYRQFTADYGDPVVEQSDQGSQLVAAGKEIKMSDMDWNQIVRDTRVKKTSWIFCPAGAKWKNGRVRAIVKKFKLSLAHLFPEHNLLLFEEAEMVFKEIASVLRVYRK